MKKLDYNTMYSKYDDGYKDETRWVSFEDNDVYLRAMSIDNAILLTAVSDPISFDEKKTVYGIIHGKHNEFMLSSNKEVLAWFDAMIDYWYNDNILSPVLITKDEYMAREAYYSMKKKNEGLLYYLHNKYPNVNEFRAKVQEYNTDIYDTENAYKEAMDAIIEKYMGDDLDTYKLR